MHVRIIIDIGIHIYCIQDAGASSMLKALANEEAAHLSFGPKSFSPKFHLCGIQNRFCRHALRILEIVTYCDIPLLHLSTAARGVLLVGRAEKNRFERKWPLKSKGGIMPSKVRYMCLSTGKGTCQVANSTMGALRPLLSCGYHKIPPVFLVFAWGFPWNFSDCLSGASNSRFPLILHKVCFFLWCSSLGVPVCVLTCLDLSMVYVFPWGILWGAVCCLSFRCLKRPFHSTSLLDVPSQFRATHCSISSISVPLYISTQRVAGIAASECSSNDHIHRPTHESKHFSQSTSLWEALAHLLCHTSVSSTLLPAKTQNAASKPSSRC